jgi:hypothetical protein
VKLIFVLVPLLLYRYSHNYDYFVGFLWRTSNVIDKFLYSFFGKLDDIIASIDKLFAPRCKCKRKKK